MSQVQSFSLSNCVLLSVLCEKYADKHASGRSGQEAKQLRPSYPFLDLNVESALGPALKATFMVMSQIGGKLLVYQSTLPSLSVGCLRLRGDDVGAYGTEKEHTLSFYGEIYWRSGVPLSIIPNSYSWGES